MTKIAGKVPLLHQLLKTKRATRAVTATHRSYNIIVLSVKKAEGVERHLLRQSGDKVPFQGQCGVVTQHWQVMVVIRGLLQAAY
jgi:hypothetical protein